jgi:glutathionylspermidine synthase
MKETRNRMKRVVSTSSSESKVPNTGAQVNQMLNTVSATRFSSDNILFSLRIPSEFWLIILTYTAHEQWARVLKIVTDILEDLQTGMSPTEHAPTSQPASDLGGN